MALLYGCAGRLTALFGGFRPGQSYTLRAAGAGKPADLPWAPYTLATVNQACAGGACTGVEGKVVMQTCPAEDAACIDANVRAYYDTSIDDAGRPVEFTRWRQYDPRVRPWYVLGKAGWTAGQGKLGYSGASCTRKRFFLQTW